MSRMPAAYTIARLRLLRTALCLLAFICQATAEEYSGSGVLDYKVFPPTNADKTIYNARFKFNFFVSNGFWQIRSEKLFPKEAVSYVLAQYDGKDIFVKTHFDDQAFHNAVGKLKPSDRGIGENSTNEAGQVLPGDFPRRGSDGIFEVWLAYCSTHYFKNAHGDHLRLLSPHPKPAMYLVDYSLPTSTSYLDTTLYLPSNCLQYSDGTIRDIALSNFIPGVTGRAQSFIYTGCYSNGFLETQYTATEVTNVSSAMLPARFSLKQFKPNPTGTTSNDLILGCEHEGLLTEISYGHSEISPTMMIARNAAVDDFRSIRLRPPLESVVYQTPANAYLPMEPGSIPYQMYVEAVNAFPETPDPADRVWSTLIVICLLFLPVIVTIWAKFRGGHSPTAPQKNN